MRQLFEHIRSVEDMSLQSREGFLAFVAYVFSSAGYAVSATPGPGYYGANLIITKDRRKTVVRAWRRPKAADFDVVKEVNFAKDYYQANGACIVSTHGFTAQAVGLANQTDVWLVTGADLLQMVGVQVDPSTDPQPSPIVSEGALFTLSQGGQGELVQYHGQEQNIVIPPDLGITRIGPHAFGNPGGRQNLPEGLTQPVCNWRRIRSVVIPEGVVAIGHDAFKGCANLQSVTLPSTLERIGAAAFEGCSSLRSIELPDSLREIGVGAFSGCSALGAIRIPGSVGTIRPETFLACRRLSWLSLSDGLRTIEGRAFEKCTSLRRIALPSSIEELAPHAFEGCDDLLEVTVVGEGCCGTFYRSAFLGCPVVSEPTPISNLPSTATLVNDAVFPAMFEGPSHKLRALRFETTVHDGRPSYLLGFLIVDRGVAGLNSFSSSSIGGESAAFWVQLDDGCDRGFYAVKGADARSRPGRVFEGHLVPEDKGYGVHDPSRREVDPLKGDFSLYLHNCHLMAAPSIDGEQAARLVDDYRAEVVPLAVTYRGVERDTSGQGKTFEEDKLATLDGLHARIWAADARFRNEARQVGLDSEYYIQTYSASLGSGLAPSAKAAQAREAETRAKEQAAYAKKARRLERSKARADAFGPLLLSFLGGCVWLVVIGFSAVVVFLLLMMLLFI